MKARSIGHSVPYDVWSQLARTVDGADSGGPAAASLSLVSAGGDIAAAAERLRRRLDEVVPGQWELSTEVVPLASAIASFDIAVKTTLTIIGVSREDFGVGTTLAQASDAAFTRAARRFGIGESAPVTSGAVLETVHVSPSPSPTPEASPSPPPVRRARSSRTTRHTVSADEDFPSCPRCGDVMWDERGSKRADDKPDFRCRRRGCNGALWIEEPAETRRESAESAATAAPAAPPVEKSVAGDEEDFPF